MPHILCVVANDAIRNPDGSYQAAGENFRVRCQAAVDWQQRSIPGQECIWAFGAGTGIDARPSATLATVCTQAFQQIYPNAALHCWVNQKDQQFYGTHEEIKWIVRQARSKEYNPADVRFVFFTQAQHMSRVQLIWKLFYQREWGQAQFIETAHAPGHELRDSRELLKRAVLYSRRYMGRPKANFDRPQWY